MREVDARPVRLQRLVVCARKDGVAQKCDARLSVLIYAQQLILNEYPAPAYAARYLYLYAVLTRL